MAKALSHDKLGITFAEHGALIGTRYMLAGGILKHTPGVFGVGHGNKHSFNMSISCDVVGCGSVSCIGGTMAMIMGMRDPYDAEHYVCNAWGELGKLFYPNHPSVSMYDITVEQSIRAIDNFLTTGRAKWHKVLGE